MTNNLFERDLLYPTENVSEPGSVHVKVLNPIAKGKIPVLIESKTEHSPVKYLSSIIRIMQSDIFDRIFIDVMKNTYIYIAANEEIKKEFGDSKYVLVVFEGDEVNYKGVDKIDQ